MKSHKLFLFILIYLGVINSICYSQSQSVFKKINQSSGLSSGSINGIEKEKNGFVWIATKNGLNRYDGADIRRYSKKNSNISSNDLSAILVDSKNRLWICTLGGGLNYYNILKDSFEVYKLDENDKNSILSNRLTSIFEDSEGQIWLGTDKGLCKLDPKTKKFTSYPNEVNIDLQKRSINITTIYEDKNNNLWIGTYGNGLFIFDKIKGKFQTIIPKHIQVSDYIQTISALNSDKILIGTKGSGMLLVDLATLQFSNYFKETLGLKQEIDIVRCIKKDSKGNLWIGTDGNGVFEIQNPNGGLPIVYNYLYNSHLESSISGNTVFEILEDEEGNMWFGTAWNGISILDRNNAHEVLYSDITGLNPTPVLSIFKTKKQLYLGLDGEGLTVYNTKSRKIEYYNKKSNYSSIKARYIQKIFEAKNGDIWLGTFSNGLIKFNGLNNDAVRYKHEFDNDISISFDDVRDIIEDVDQNLWLATWGGGINYFDTNTKKFTSFRDKIGSKSITLNNDNVIDLEPDGDKIWMATFGGGLNVFDTRTKSFDFYTHNDKDSTTLSTNNIFSIYKDSKNFLWIGTFGEGINRMNLKTNKIERFENIDDIKYVSITGIIEDSNNVIWFSTQQGIINYDYKTNKFHAFPNFPGEFHINSILKDEQGLLYFGGMNGILKIDPNKIDHLALKTPKVIITNFKLNGVSDHYP